MFSSQSPFSMALRWSFLSRMSIQIRCSYAVFHLSWICHSCLRLPIKEDVIYFPKGQSPTRLWVVLIAFIQHEDHAQVDFDSLLGDNDDRRLWFHADVLQATQAQSANGLWRREGKGITTSFRIHVNVSTMYMYTLNYRNQKWKSPNLLDWWKDGLCPSRPFGRCEVSKQEMAPSKSYRCHGLCGHVG